MESESVGEGWIAEEPSSTCACVCCVCVVGSSFNGGVLRFAKALDDILRPPDILWYGFSPCDSLVHMSALLGPDSIVYVLSMLMTGQQVWSVK